MYFSSWRLPLLITAFAQIGDQFRSDRRTGSPRFLPQQNTLSRLRNPGPSAPYQSRHNGSGNEPIDSVEHATMTGNQRAGILNPDASFQCRFEKIARLFDYRQNRPDTTEPE